ncbi:MAG: hypothetical protein ACTSXV_01330, partial [Alphaproteobacteria bacterium]
GGKDLKDVKSVFTKTLRTNYLQTDHLEILEMLDFPTATFEKLTVSSTFNSLGGKETPSVFKSEGTIKTKTGTIRNLHLNDLTMDYNYTVNYFSATEAIISTLNMKNSEGMEEEETGTIEALYEFGIIPDEECEGDDCYIQWPDDFSLNVLYILKKADNDSILVTFATNTTLETPRIFFNEKEGESGLYLNMIDLSGSISLLRGVDTQYDNKDVSIQAIIKEVHQVIYQEYLISLSKQVKDTGL